MCDLSTGENLVVLFRIPVAINSRIIDGAISGATSGRIPAVWRYVELEISVVNVEFRSRTGFESASLTFYPKSVIALAK